MSRDKRTGLMLGWCAGLTFSALLAGWWITVAVGATVAPAIWWSDKRDREVPK